MIEEKYFLMQIKRTNGTYEKGVVVKDTLDAAAQSYFAYFGAYAFGHDPNTDYVQCRIFGDNGAEYESKIWDNRTPAQVEEG